MCEHFSTLKDVGSKVRSHATNVCEKRKVSHPDAPMHNTAPADHFSLLSACRVGNNYDNGRSHVLRPLFGTRFDVLVILPCALMGGVKGRAPSFTGVSAGSSGLDFRGAPRVFCILSRALATTQATGAGSLSGSFRLRRALALCEDLSLWHPT